MGGIFSVKIPGNCSNFQWPKNCLQRPRNYFQTTQKLFPMAQKVRINRGQSNVSQNFLVRRRLTDPGRRNFAAVD
jgi:hypothetical protein